MCAASSRTGYTKIVAQLRLLFLPSPPRAFDLRTRSDFNSFVHNPVHFPFTSARCAEMMPTSPFCTHRDALQSNIGCDLHHAVATPSLPLAKSLWLIVLS